VCPVPICGDGKVEGSEGCDDGNTMPSDGCSGTCMIENGYFCPFPNAPCVPNCGDGIVLAPMEQCDPAVAGTNMALACSSTCKYNDGWVCTGSPPSCHQTVCGDGRAEGSEGCDDGNTVSGDGCSPSCHLEPNCGAGGMCTPKCGDGILTNEACDDGNTNNGDGCSATCTLEPGFLCTQANADAGVASTCGPICGDGLVQPGEQCDNGAARNLGGYGQCTVDCRLGHYCGDGTVTDAEECDNGRNNDDYGSSSGCGPFCKLPALCGDSIVQAGFDEECDNGPKNFSTTDLSAAYGGCMANCKRGGYCGDGKTNGVEACDDGVNDGTYGTCNPDCSRAPRCGDGTVQADYGEECEPTMSNDPSCTPGCRLPGGCGDGLIQPPEQCDDGASFNNGDYGGCAPSCIYAPHCGDGVKNGPEQCDDGILDASYGGCTPQCKLAPHCGDGIVNGAEECDDGPGNGKDGMCTAGCKQCICLPP
jgi:cysteine-rich repeat protein